MSYSVCMSELLTTDKPSYRKLLQDEFAQRQEKNGSYSVRAFAKHLGVNKTTLAEVLTFRRHLSPKNAQRVFEKLQWQNDVISFALEEIRKRKPRTRIEPPSNA